MSVSEAGVVDVPEEILRMSTEDIQMRNRLIEGDIRVMRSEMSRLKHEVSSMKERLQDNLEKIKLNKQLPYLVANVVELLDVDPEDEMGDGDEGEEGANVDLDSQRKGKCAVVKTSTRTVIDVIFLTFLFFHFILDFFLAHGWSRRCGQVEAW